MHLIQQCCRGAIDTVVVKGSAHESGRVDAVTESFGQGELY